ncbi:MAG TPA: hypothetical protein VFE33_10405 [Thermoanaerobaculia bacterium]|nr:hypothetical protein [Thermoanaerobaculia bacterium]
MIRKTYLRRVLLVTVVAAGLALAPPAGARASALVPPADSPRWTEPGNPFTLVWHWLTNVWGEEGSSMDPFGRH